MCCRLKGVISETCLKPSRENVLHHTNYIETVAVNNDKTAAEEDHIRAIPR